MVYKPKFNPIYPYFYSADNTLKIGVTPDKTFEIEDENGAVNKLISLMDGNKSIKQLIKLMNTIFPTIEAIDIENAIQDLKNLGVLINNERKMHDLKDIELERFKGNINYISHFSDPNIEPAFYQEKISNSKITILGMGAFGCSLLMNLAGLGVKKIKIVDFDTVSLSNLNRQILFNENNIGELKIDVAERYMESFYSDMEIEKVNIEIESSEMVEAIIEDSDLVILAADQPFLVLPRWVNNACIKKEIPFITGSINIKYGQFYSIIPNLTGCVDCMHLKNLKESAEYIIKAKKFLDLNYIPPNMATAPNLFMITGIISSEVFKILTNLEVPLSAGKMFMFDFMTYELSTLNDWDKQYNCPTCSNGNEEGIFNIFNNKEYSKRKVVIR